MKTINMTADELKLVPRKNWAAYVVPSVGGTEQYASDGDDLMEMFQDDNHAGGSTTLYDLLMWQTHDMNRNEYEILRSHEGMIVRVRIVN